MSKERWEQWYPDDKEPPTPTPWWRWQVPVSKVNHYLFMLFVMLVGIPWMLGMKWTSFSLLINFALVDFILYSYYKQ
jgi:cytochrome b561|tara:strand:+ start:262 stop:492 length:231 start_codon:yes stop_codon:yes gene_type:complete